MRALWLEDRKLSLRGNVRKPAKEGEVLVRVLLAGICNTDIELTRGYYPFKGVPGHEFVGVLEDGRRVVGEINVACGTCETCLAGRRTHCEQRSVLGIINRSGAFAEYLTLPPENLHIVPDDVSDEEAVFTEPLAAALQIQEQVHITAADRVLVVGMGKLGRLIAQTLALTGCDLTLLARGETPPKNRRYDVAVECTGNQDGFTLARGALRPRGTLVMKSTYAGELKVNAASLVVDEITLIGSRCGPFAPALHLLESRQVDVHPLIQGIYQLDDAIEAYEHAKRRGALKILLRVG